jgi:hypothetical protein
LIRQLEKGIGRDKWTIEKDEKLHLFVSLSINLGHRPYPVKAHRKDAKLIPIRYRHASGTMLGKGARVDDEILIYCPV